MEVTYLLVRLKKCLKSMVVVTRYEGTQRAVYRVGRDLSCETVSGILNQTSIDLSVGGSVSLNFAAVGRVSKTPELRLERDFQNITQKKIYKTTHMLITRRK